MDDAVVIRPCWRDARSSGERADRDRNQECGRAPSRSLHLFPPSYVRDCCGIGSEFTAQLWRDGSVRCAVRLPAFRLSFLDVANLGVHAHVLAPPLFLDFSALEIVAARGALGRLVELIRPLAQGIAEPWSFR